MLDEDIMLAITLPFGILFVLEILVCWVLMIKSRRNSDDEKLNKSKKILILTVLATIAIPVIILFSYRIISVMGFSGCFILIEELIITATIVLFIMSKKKPDNKKLKKITKVMIIVAPVTFVISIFLPTIIMILSS